MVPSRVFLDTSFLQALINRNDQLHDQAKILWPQVRLAAEVWLTEAILLEVGNALCARNRSTTAQFIQECFRTPNMRVVPVDSLLFKRGLQLYRERLDKTWSLTDCISFIVMQDQNLKEAVTVDAHFVQAGFRALMRKD